MFKELIQLNERTNPTPNRYIEIVRILYKLGIRIFGDKSISICIKYLIYHTKKPYRSIFFLCVKL